MPAVVLLQGDGGLSETAVSLAVDVALHPFLNDDDLHCQYSVPLLLQELVVGILEYWGILGDNYSIFSRELGACYCSRCRVLEAPVSPIPTQRPTSAVSCPTH